MTTTELIAILKNNEFGITGRPREIWLSIDKDDLLNSDAMTDEERETVDLMRYEEHSIKVIGGGDGIGGAQLDLKVVVNV